MTVEIVEESIEGLAGHGQVPIAFEVRSRVRVEAQGLVEVPVDMPWVKDYDTEAEGGPAGWAARFDVSRWGLLVAREAGRRIGGAVVAWNTPGVDMLEGREDLAVLWDLRIDTPYRRQGVGAALFTHVESWVRARGCTRLDVETQDINVGACRFYASRGCTLRRVDLDAYP